MPRIDLRPFCLNKTKGCDWSFDEFIDFIKAQDGTVLRGLKGSDRIWLCNDDKNFLYCCLITNLGIGGGTTLDLANLVEITWNVTDDSVNYKKNLMVISKVGEMGIYQSQAETFPMSDLNAIFMYFSRMFKEQKVQTDVLAGEEQDVAEDKWSGHYFSRSEMTEVDFLNMVTKMKEVHDFSWLIDVTKNKGGLVTPLMRHAKRNSGRISFNPVSGKLSGVRSFVKNMGPSKARIEGLDENGAEVIYHLQQKYEVMESHSEVEWKRRWNKTIKEFNETLAIKTMSRILNSDKARFMTRKT